ncbi:MAG: cadherin-like domain-containing protein, partial [Actinomycetota bacterium]|nr:cadherin-like domain-containing protein [Actinomycetota bacterium]
PNTSPTNSTPTTKPQPASGGGATKPPPTGGGGTPTGTGTGGTPTQPPTAGDDYFTGSYTDGWNYVEPATGRGWWELVVGANDNAPHAFEVVSVGAPRYQGAYTAKAGTLCDGTHLCVWYSPPCDGSYRDSFTYTIKDDTTGLTATATVTIDISWSNDGPQNDCTG